MRYKFTSISSNVKTGPIPVTMTERDSCPDSCPLKKNGCYADNFPLSLHWDKVAESGLDLVGFLGKLKALSRGQLWRHNVAGDFPHVGGSIVADTFKAFVKAVKHTRPIIYSHHMLNAVNSELFKLARENGVVVNASCESLEQAREAIDKGINAVFIGSSNVKAYKSDGINVVTCPAQMNDRITCAKCGLCARDRIQNRIAVQFIPHGTRSKKVLSVIGG